MKAHWELGVLGAPGAVEEYLDWRLAMASWMRAVSCWAEAD